MTGWRRGRGGFDDAPHTRARGGLAEDQAAAYLEGAGYRILERNVTTKVGEVDVVAADGDTLCFVEVKARLTDRHGPAVEAVTPAKQRRLLKVASYYLAYRTSWDGPVRFDVLGLDADPSGGWRFTLLRDAFQG
jgi:putative endonuclease